MVEFDLEQTYDVIVCLFSSIGYVRTAENLVRAISCFRRHLADDGLVILEPWFRLDTWQPAGKVTMLTAETELGKICCMSTSSMTGLRSVIDFHYLIGTTGEVRYLHERHELGLFTEAEIIAGFAQAGLTAVYHENGFSGKSIYIAHRL